MLVMDEPEIELLVKGYLLEKLHPMLCRYIENVAQHALSRGESISYSDVEISMLDMANWLVVFLGVVPEFQRGLTLPQVAAQVQRFEPVSMAVRWQVFARDRFACRKCGTQCDLTIDHMLAKSKGGTNDPENLQTLCRSCNSSKGVR